jgi:hypothetical protein
MVRNVDLMENLQHQASANGRDQTLRCLLELASALDALQRTYNRRMILDNLFVKLVTWRQVRPRITASHG